MFVISLHEYIFLCIFTYRFFTIFFNFTVCFPQNNNSLFSSMLNTQPLNKYMWVSVKFQVLMPQTRFFPELQRRMISWVKKKTKRNETRLNMLVGVLVDLCIGTIWDRREVRGHFNPGEIGRLYHGRGLGKCSGMPTEWFCISILATHVFWWKQARLI